MSKRAVFLDRDGVLNELVLNPKTGEYESPLTIGEVRIIAGAADGARKLNAAGFMLFVVSNQPNYTKQKNTLEELHAIAQHIRTTLEREQVVIVQEYYCFHHPSGVVPGYSGPCACRKPGSKSLFDARDAHGLDLAQCWMIGDQGTDVQCGKGAGCRTILIENPNSAHRRTRNEAPTLRATSLLDAVGKLLAAL